MDASERWFWIFSVNCTTGRVIFQEYVKFGIFSIVVDELMLVINIL